MRINKIILCLAFICTSCRGTITYIPKLPGSEIRREENIIQWVNADYSQEQYFYTMGFEYWDKVSKNRFFDRSIYGLHWKKYATIREKMISAGLELILFNKREIKSRQYKLGRRGENIGQLSIHAFRHDDYLDTILKNSDGAKYFFLIIKVEDYARLSYDSFQYFELLIFKVKKESIEYWTHPLFKKQCEEGQENKDFYYKTKKKFPEYFDSPEREEFMAETFELVKDDILANKVKFKAVEW